MIRLAPYAAILVLFPGFRPLGPHHQVQPLLLEKPLDCESTCCDQGSSPPLSERPQHRHSTRAVSWPWLLSLHPLWRLLLHHAPFLAQQLPCAIARDSAIGALGLHTAFQARRSSFLFSSALALRHLHRYLHLRR